MAQPAAELIMLLGDIHANEAALLAVLDDAAARYPGRRLPIWFLGDLFGRGPRPAAVYRRLLLAQLEAAVLGNHEGGLAGFYENARFGRTASGHYNNDDWQVLLLQREELHGQGLLVCADGRVVGGEVFDTIRAWPTIHAPRPTVYMVHGGLERPFVPPPVGDIGPLRDRLVWEYVNTAERAEYTLDAIDWIAANRPDDPAVALWPGAPVEPELVLVGHWHARLLFDRAANAWHNPVQLDVPYALDGRTALLSPGSVGFPRSNGELDASYCVLSIKDQRPVQAVFHKATYDRAAVRNEMVRKGYPPATVRRLRLPGETETAKPAARRQRRGCAPESED